MKRIIFLFTILATTAFIIAACNKEKSGTTLHVHLTDNPINMEEVNVDIQEVWANFRHDSSGWISLNTNAGIYNLLGLQNGVDSLLAVGFIPTNVVQEVRLVLGSDNSVKVDGQVFPLTVPSGAESGLKIKVGRSLNSPVDSLTIDFDAALSIHQDGNGDYILQPVLKLK